MFLKLIINSYGVERKAVLRQRQRLIEVISVETFDGVTDDEEYRGIKIVRAGTDGAYYDRHEEYQLVTEGFPGVLRAYLMNAEGQTIETYRL